MKTSNSSPLTLADPNGGDMAEWTEDLRVRQWPAMLMDRAKAQADGADR